MALLLDGRKARDEIRARLIHAVKKANTPPTLAIIQVGENSASSAYINQKRFFGESIGALVALHSFPETVREADILGVIENLNNDGKVHGIIIQLPIPNALDIQRIIDAIDPLKDVDGLTATNTKKLWTGEPGHVPATAKGVLSLLSFYDIPVTGKKVTVVGRSNLVGKPTALLMLARGATVTIAHRETKDLRAATKSADILIVAAGHPKLITPDHVHEKQVVVDVGINLLTGEKLAEEIDPPSSGKKFVGDVDFDAVKDRVAAISPVPGGVGPMTVASLFENLLNAYQTQKG